MPDAYDYITLMCRLKTVQARNKELESGERYIQRCRENVSLSVYSKHY